MEWVFFSKENITSTPRATTFPLRYNLYPYFCTIVNETWWKLPGHVGFEVEVMNKPSIEGGGEGENRGCQKGGPTKLPAKGGGHQQRPGKEEPFVGWRKEGTTDLKPLAKQVGGEEELKTNPFTLVSMVVEWRWSDQATLQLHQVGAHPGPPAVQLFILPHHAPGTP